MRAGGVAAGRREEGCENRCLTMTDTSQPLKDLHTFCVVGVVLPFSVPCPGVTRCCTTLLCYACCVPRRPKAHHGPTASFPAPGDTEQRSCEQKSRCRWGRSVIASSLAARTSSRLCLKNRTCIVTYLAVHVAWG